MIIHVKEIPITGRDNDGIIHKEDIDLDYQFIAPIAFQCNVQKSGQDVRVRGTVTTKISEECQRCLEPFELSLSIPIELYYQPSPEHFSDMENLNAEDLGTIYYKDNIIDLTESLRDTIIFAIPMKLLCKPDCKGLCQYCGINLNYETCHCKPEVTINNPFQQILKQMQKD